MVLGRYQLYRLYKNEFGSNWHFEIPFSIPLTALLPFTVGAFTSFRFRLWHYLAYTALIAAELAYYFAPGST